MNFHQTCRDKEASLGRDFFNYWLRYDPETGRFSWKEKPSVGVSIGDDAGWLAPSGYCFVQIKGQAFALHRVAWLLETGSWPEDQIDHINGVRYDNRFSNLREATSRENSQNMVQHRDKRLPGASVHKPSGRWVCQVKVFGKVYYLGLHDSEEDAHAIYKEVVSADDTMTAVKIKRAQLGLTQKE